MDLTQEQKLANKYYVELTRNTWALAVRVDEGVKITHRIKEWCTTNIGPSGYPLWQFGKERSYHSADRTERIYDGVYFGRDEDKTAFKLAFGDYPLDQVLGITL